jgi:formate dehydrogenase
MKVFAAHEKIQIDLKEHPISGIEIVDDPKAAHFLITGRYNDAQYHSNLKGVIIPYTGHNRINLEDLRKRDLMLFVTPTRSRWVAEKAVTLTLALLGNTIQYHTLLQEGKWASRNSEHRVPWTSIQDLTVGLFGYGRIGRLIHQFLAGFGCDFYTIDRGKVYPKGIKTVKNLTNLLQISDVIIISTPLNKETEGLFDEEKFRSLRNKYLVNVGRGKIVDEKALYEALASKRIGGYASDVWYQYPQGKEVQFPSSYPIHQLDNVVLSNHSGGFTHNTNQEVNNDLRVTLEKLQKEDYTDQLDLTTLI